MYREYGERGYIRGREVEWRDEQEIGRLVDRG